MGTPIGQDFKYYMNSLSGLVVHDYDDNNYYSKIMISEAGSANANRARIKLIEGNLRIVVKEAFTFNTAGRLSIMDLVEAGNSGL